MINDNINEPVRQHIEDIINSKNKLPGLIPRDIFYTFLMYFAETNPKYFPAILM